MGIVLGWILAERYVSRTAREWSATRPEAGMRLGVHIVNFEVPGGPEQIGPTLAESARPSRRPASTTSPSWTTTSRWRWRAVPRSRCSRATRPWASWPAHTSTRRAAAAGHRRHLPPPRPAGEDRDDPRRALRRSRHARHRRRLVRARAPRPRRAVPARWPSGSSGSRRRCRSSCRCGATTTARTQGRHYSLAETINVAAGRSHGRTRRS